MSGESHETKTSRRRSRGLIAAAGTIALLAALAGATCAEDHPITAADAAPMVSSGGRAGATSSTSARPGPATGNVGDYVPASLTESVPVGGASAESIHTSSPSSPQPAAEEREVPDRPTITTPTVPKIDGPGNDAMIAAPETQEIPPAPVSQATAMAKLPPMTVPEVDDLNAYINYDTSPVRGVGNLGSYVAEAVEVSPLGLEMRESHRRLKTGETAEGMLIVKVEKDSAAARAGLRPYRRATHTVLEGLAIGAALVFPPAILAVPVIDYTQVGESYDMIIGVDGSRISNVLDFEDRMRNIVPGQTVYFNVVRNGQRIQVPVPIPAFSAPAYSSAATE